MRYGKRTLARHATSDGVDTKADVDALRAQDTPEEHQVRRMTTKLLEMNVVDIVREKRLSDSINVLQLNAEFKSE